MTSKRTKAILALTVAMALTCASVSAAIDLPYVDVGSNDAYDDFNSPPIWTNTKTNGEHDEDYCGPGSGRSISRCPGFGRGGHSFPGDIDGAPGAGPGDWDDRFRRRHSRRAQGSSGKDNNVHKREIDTSNSDLHLEDIHFKKRAVNFPGSELHLEDVHVDFDKRQDTYYDPEKDPEPDVFENDVKIYKRSSSGGKVKRSVVIYDKEPHLSENTGSFEEVMPLTSRKMKRQDVDQDDDFDMDEADEDEGEERRLDDEAGVQDWIEEMKLEELLKLEGHPDGLHLDDEENQDGQTPSEEEIFAAHWESA